jgi:sarcosine oxidase
VSFDIVIAGLGAVGSAAAYHLAGRGLRVLGLERYHPPHALGSSHGESRVIRETAFEHPHYVPLARRAYENWRRLEVEAGEPLLRVTGVLFVGSLESPLIAGTLSSARVHSVPHELLAASDLDRRFPALQWLDDAVGVFEPGGGWLDPERCVAANLRLAAERGVSLRFDEPLESWEPDGDGVVVTTARERFRAGRLLLAAGPWMPELLEGAGASLSVERQVQHWFSPVSADAARLPIFIRQVPEGVFYALPPAGDQIKVAVHHSGAATTPATVDRDVSPAEIAAVRALLDRYAPALAGAHRRAAVCLYTNSPDGHFVIDRHPAHPAVVVASPCSGYGFKFASAVGEILADLLQDRTAAFDLAPFSIRR